MPLGGTVAFCLSVCPSVTAGSPAQSSSAGRRQLDAAAVRLPSDGAASVAARP